MNDDLIAALEWAVGQAQGCQADAATLRGLITDLHAGKLVRRKDVVAEEWARVVNYIADQAAFWLRHGHCGTAAVVQNIADAIASGAHIIEE